MGVDTSGGTTFTSVGESSTAGGWVLKESPSPFTSGTGGVITIAYRGGYNGGDGTGWIDDIALAPAKPSTTGGSATICQGSSTNITASGGWGGTDSELHWYTGAGGTGMAVGTGTTLSVSPTVTTTYYPRWEASGSCSGCCVSNDGASVTVTVVNDTTPPAVTAAVSRKTHLSSAGDLDIDLLAPRAGYDVAVEDRAGGPSELHITFSESIFGTGGLDTTDVSVKTGGGAIAVNAVSIGPSGKELIVQHAAVPDNVRVTVGFPGIVDSCGNFCLNTTKVCFGILKGDADGNGATNQLDLVAVRGKFGQAVTQATCRYDVDLSGVIDQSDLVAVRDNKGKTLPSGCP
jgi:hypothetical protein